MSGGTSKSSRRLGAGRCACRVPHGRDVPDLVWQICTSTYRNVVVDAIRAIDAGNQPTLAALAPTMHHPPADPVCPLREWYAEAGLLVQRARCARQTSCRSFGLWGTSGGRQCDVCRRPGVVGCAARIRRRVCQCSSSGSSFIVRCRCLPRSTLTRAIASCAPVVSPPP